MLRLDSRPPFPKPYHPNTTHISGPLVDSSHGHLDNRKGTSAHRHGPQQSRHDTPPEPPQPLAAVRLREAVAHRLVPLLGAEAVRLHLALDDVERVAAEPQRLAGEASVPRDLVAGDLLAVDLVARRVRVHHPLEREEPHAVRLRLAPDRHRLAAVQALEHAAVRRQLAHAVERARVQPRRAVRLRLQADAYVLDRARDD